jgi:hypothetical protein
VNCDGSAWEETSVTIDSGMSRVKFNGSAWEDTQWSLYIVGSRRLKCVSVV